jgi:hypothetical protein
LTICLLNRGDAEFNKCSEFSNLTIYFFMKIISFLVIFIAVSIELQAQPLLPGWSALLKGTWRVDRMDTLKLEDGVNMFLEFQETKLLMHNQLNVKEAEWKALEGKRELLIKSDGNSLEAWQIKYIDSFNLSIFDTVGYSNLYLTRYNGNLEDGKHVNTVRCSRSDITGTWLLVSIDNGPIPANVNLTLDIMAAGKLSVKVARETQQFYWKFRKNLDGLSIRADSISKPKDWIFTELEKDRLSFMDNGKLMSFTRYIAPLSTSHEALLAGKWKIMEVEGSELPNNESFSRYMELNKNGKLYFYTNDKKEGEGSWGVNSTKTGLFVLSGGGTELWNIYHLKTDELLLEMEGIKMLLKK